MNRSELVRAYAEEQGVSLPAANSAVSTVLFLMERQLAAGNEVRLADFGVFSVKKRGERPGRNPITGEEVTIPATNVVHFKPSKALKEAVQ